MLHYLQIIFALAPDTFILVTMPLPIIFVANINNFGFV